MPAISVVIPAYAAADTIGACLMSLATQTGAPLFEVIVVDSSPDAATEVALRQEVARQPELDVRYQHLPQRVFPGVARNAGAQLARADVLLFLDADCVAASDLVAQAARALAAGAGAVSGSIALAARSTAAAHLRHLLEFKESLPSCPPRRTWQLPSACVAIRREVLVRHGGFPESRASEDWLLDWRMWQAGEDLRFDPALRVVHRTQPGWIALWRYSRLLGFHSGVARRRGGLPGQMLVRWPWLALLLLPPGRTLRALLWCGRNARQELPFLVLFWPAYLAMASVWAWGFRAGVRDPTTDDERLAPNRASP